MSKGFSDAEALADETIDRVIVRLPDIEAGYIGEPFHYFLGVSRYIIMEARRNPETALEITQFSTGKPPEKLDEYELLIHCLKLLPIKSQELILDYYLYQGHEKVEQHKQMASELAISTGALRGRAHHIRVNLENCVKNKLALSTKRNLLLSTS